MGRAISVVLACVVGIPFWLLPLALLSNNPIGKAGGMEAVLFFTPLLGVAAPASWSLAKSRSIASAAWVVALGPVLSVLNFVLVLSLTPHWAIDTAYPGFASLLWLSPLLYSLYRATRNPDA